MTNRSTFPTTIDTFNELSNIINSDKTNVDRYKELLMKTIRTIDEETELTNLKNVLKYKITDAEYFNRLQDCIYNLEDYFLNRVMADVKKTEAGALRADLGYPNNLTTDNKVVVDAINELNNKKLPSTTTVNNLGGLSSTEIANNYINKNQFSYNLLSIGWRKLPDNTIEQWGYLDLTGLIANNWTSRQINFPIAFPNQCFVVNTDIYASAGSYGESNCGYFTKTGCTIYIKPESAGATSVLWRAIGV